MSGHGDEPFHPEVVEFMRIVMKRLDVHSVRELARALGTTSADEERRIYRWVRGKSAPKFFNTMDLLDAAGMLNSEFAGWYGEMKGTKK